jgi:site-specific DNA-cytosine methylase
MNPRRRSQRVLARTGGSGQRIGRATTICADPRGHHEGSQNAGAVGVEQAGDARPVRLTIEQGGALMGFPSDLTAVIDRAKISQAAAWALIGNAVCPPVARAVLA